jgi:hypothetical protein
MFSAIIGWSGIVLFGIFVVAVYYYMPSLLDDHANLKDD